MTNVEIQLYYFVKPWQKGGQGYFYVDIIDIATKTALAKELLSSKSMPQLLRKLAKCCEDNQYNICQMVVQ